MQRWRDGTTFIGLVGVLLGCISKSNAVCEASALAPFNNTFRTCSDVL